MKAQGFDPETGQLREYDLTPDELQLLDAAIFAEPPADLASWCGWPVSKARRLIKSLVRRGLMRAVQMETHSGGRKYIAYRREGPED